MSTIELMGSKGHRHLPAVDAFWRSERIDAAQCERVLPTGRAQVIVDLDTGDLVLVRPRTVSAVVAPARRSAGFSLSGVGLARIIGGDARELLDTTIDLRDIGGVLPCVLDRNGDVDLRAVARHLVTRFEVDERIVVAERLLRSGSPASSVASRVGFDRRTFVPAFRSVVGVAPKHYELLGRLLRANAALRSPNPIPLAVVAAEAGFADQAHMTRDLRRFIGNTPSQIRRLAPGPPNHVPADVEA